MYTDGLSPQHAAQYFVDRPDAPAMPLVWFLTGAFWHLLATALLYQAAHFLGWTFLIFIAVFSLVIWFDARGASKWKPVAVDQIDPEKLRALPASIKVILGSSHSEAEREEESVDAILDAILE